MTYSTYEIRLLGPTDAAALERVDPDVFDDPVVPSAAAEFLRDPRHYIAVAVAEGVVVGFASAVCYLHPDKQAPELWINEVGVAAAHQGQGLAKKILECLLNEARRSGCAEAWVLTDRDNTAAMRLYRAAGGIEAPRDATMFTFPLLDVFAAKNDE
jgi:aminoglycoside 6'-N-acetyltransferase I